LFRLPPLQKLALVAEKPKVETALALTWFMLLLKR